MRHAILASILSVCLAGSALAQHRPARHAGNPAEIAVMPRLPSQPAFETTKGDDAACATGARLLSRAAYMPGETASPSIRCGQPLSTDTLMTVHRWSQT